MEGAISGPTRRLTPSRAKVLREAGSPLWPTQLMTSSRLHRGCRTAGSRTVRTIAAREFIHQSVLIEILRGCPAGRPVA